MNLTETQRKKVVQSLLQAQEDLVQTTRPSAVYPDIDFDDAYDISSKLSKAMIKNGANLIGYKVGLTSVAMRRSSKIDEPDYGYVYEHYMIPDGGTVKHADYLKPRVEPELVFVLKEPLQGPGVTLLDVMRATEYVVPSIEIIDTRVDEPRKIYDTISDNGAAAGLILGGTPIRPHDMDLRMIPGVLYKNADIEETGVACGVMNHPANGIAWLANKLAEIGVSLKAGDIMLSGSFTRPVWAQVGDTIRADFGTLGSVSVKFE